MKAIEVRYLACTNRLPARIKAFTDVDDIIECFDSDKDFEEQAFEMANKYIDKMGWKVTITGMGYISNGDYIVTVGEA